ncbi:MAG: winged helix-turn-helix transcriptional regulator [Roseburia sp.]|nr:winged helix-turn-helix transcriptional regulator [Anaeroplasma bactoclasticum]MCM1196020.1 winged helix-turn-helix transcriptional regulator [Roseburia sp.]MCM1557086.1 winged helix-turn-helix transcriptional regulator [Anaeroplasma bactoclasticum]
MEKLIDLVIEFKKTKSEKILEEVLKIVKPMMWRYVHKINYFYEEDFIQILTLRTYDAILKFEIKLDPNDFNTYLINQKQFIHYLMKKFKYAVADFYRENSNHLENEIICTNADIVFPDNSLGNNSLYKTLFDYGFLESEIQFLCLFIEEDRFLSQKEVADKLGISQQTVSRQFNKIVKKYGGVSKTD